MWRRDDIKYGCSYRVGLRAHQDGSRTFHLLTAGDACRGYDFITPIIDYHEPLKWGRYEEIISRYGVDGDTEIIVDAHGLWLTASEADQLDDELPDIKWYRGIAPAFAPK